MKKFIVFTCIILVSVIQSYASQITRETALSLAKSFIAQKYKNSLRSAESLQLVYTGKDDTTGLRSADEAVYLYIFNEADQGYVIISAEDRTEPVLGYSDEGPFTPESVPAGLQIWLDMYEEAIRHLIETNQTTTVDETASDQTSNSIKATVSISPLLGNIKWGQGDPYNTLCPYDQTESTNALVGCVATGMAQVMKYWEWPVRGTGSKSYVEDDYGTLTADFGTTTYDWDNMTDTYDDASTAIQKTAVATLMYHCGVSVGMNYGVAGSSSSLNEAGKALVSYFGYDTDVKVASRPYYTSAEWIALVKSELISGSPVIYRGSDDNSGHLFVCDGVDNTDYFHINWGWNGYCNGYFNLNVMEPYSDEVGGYNISQDILIGVRKPDGVSSQDSRFKTYWNGMACDNTVLDNIVTSSMTLSMGVLHVGSTNFTGLLGVGLYKDGVDMGIRYTYSINNLWPSYGYSSLTFPMTWLSTCQTGEYQLRGIYKMADSTSWSFIRGSSAWNSYLNVTVSGQQAVISKPSAVPSLTVTQAVTQQHNVYQEKQADFSVTIRNDGAEFFSYLTMYILSATDTLQHQYLDYGVVCIPSGETRTVNYSGNISLSPGQYLATVCYDSTNNYSESGYKALLPDSLGTFAFTVKPTPGTPALVLTSKIALSDNAITFHQGETITLNANITNTGGFFDSYVIAFVFPKLGGTSLTYLGPKIVCIDSLSTVTVPLTGVLDLAPDSYFFGTYYYNNDEWNQLTPSTSAKLSFTITEPLSVQTEALQEGITLYPNPVKEVLNISTSDVVEKVVIMDFSGRVLRQASDTKTLETGGLQKGIYLITVKTGKTRQTLRFVKQ